MTNIFRSIGCENMKDILILVDFCGSMNGTGNSRFLYLADMLSKDNQVEIVTSDFDHGSKEYFHRNIEKKNFLVTMIHEGRYSKNISIRRCLSHFVWGKNVKKYLRDRKKPDVIYCAIPTLTASYEAARYCEKHGIRFVIDVQDLWPEAFQMIFHVPIISNILFAPFKVLADGAYRRADAICAVSDTYCKRALKVNNKCKESTTVFLGTDLSIFDSYVSGYSLFEKKKDEIWLAYCGTLGSSYDIVCVIDALALLKNEKLRFIVMGDGPQKGKFNIYAKEKGIRTTFTGYLPYNHMCNLLSSCDIAVNPITHMAAQSIINKHADYTAAGLPIISTQESKEFRQLVDEYQMGFNCKNGDFRDLAEKIKMFVDDEELRIAMGRNARRCAEERFDRGRSYQKIIELIK